MTSPLSGRGIAKRFQDIAVTAPRDPPAWGIPVTPRCSVRAQPESAPALDVSIARQRHPRIFLGISRDWTSAAASRAAGTSTNERVPLREIIDEEGEHWQVFDVYPTDGAQTGVLRESFLNGWLCFQSIKGRRRVVPIPEGWAEISDQKLRLMLSVAPPTSEVPKVDK